MQIFHTLELFVTRRCIHHKIGLDSSRLWGEIARIYNCHLLLVTTLAKHGLISEAIDLCVRILANIAEMHHPTQVRVSSPLGNANSGCSDFSEVSSRLWMRSWEWSFLRARKSSRNLHARHGKGYCRVVWIKYRIDWAPSIDKLTGISYQMCKDHVASSLLPDSRCKL